MPKVPITMPQLGESMAEATIVAIKVKPGDKVAVDQEIIEVETDKAVMGVTTPCPGEIAGDRGGSEEGLRGRRGARLRRGERGGRGAFHEDRRRSRRRADVAKEVPGREEEAASRTAAARISRSTRRSCRRSPTGSHFQVDQDGRPAGARGRERRGLSFAAGEGAHGRAATHAGRSRGHPGQRQCRAGHDQGSGNFSRRPGETNGGRRERDSHRRGRCDAAQLDAAAGHGGRFGLSRSRAGRSEKARSETGSGVVCFARARFGAGGDAGRGRASDRQSRAALRVDRYRRRGRSAGRDHGPGHSQCGQDVVRRPDESNTPSWSISRAGAGSPPR